MAARVGVAADLLDHLGDLVDVPAVGGRPGAPLVAVDRPEVAVRVGPLVPDRDAAVLQPLDVGVAAQEPQQLAEDADRVWTFFVVTSGKPSARSKRIWWPNTQRVPVPVRSPFSAPSSRIRWRRSR